MARPRILLVDDELGILELLKMTLEIDNVPVDATLESDGRAALTRLGMQDFDLVFTDFRMPGVTGVELLRASRRHNPGGKRVLFTGYNEVPADAEHLADAKPDLILHKPISPEEFSSTVRSLLRLTA